MKITDFQFDKADSRQRISARVTWEDCGEPEQEFYLETAGHDHDVLAGNPHIFLAAALLPAVRKKERRLRVDAEVCPELHSGLLTVLRTMQCWYPSLYPEGDQSIQLEYQSHSQSPAPPSHPRSLVFISGGIDSISTLRANRLEYPRSHPGSFQEAILVKGLQREVDAIFDSVHGSIAELADAADLAVTVVDTNIRYLYDDWWFWMNEWFGAVFAAVAHAFTPRGNSVTIPPTNDLLHLHPHGSHPLTDPLYSSAGMHIRHGDASRSRVERTRLVAGWEPALHRIRVCNKPEAAGKSQNCGHCEKCVRTMLALVALDKLSDSRAFPATELTATNVEAIQPLNHATSPFFYELVSPLAKAGRTDLVRAVEQKLRAYEQAERRQAWRARIANPIQAFDQRFLNGQLLKWKRQWRGEPLP